MRLLERLRCVARIGSVDHWVENLRCPRCLRTGKAELAAQDKLSWDIELVSTPEGFKVVHSAANLFNFYCVSCDKPVDP